MGFAGDRLGANPVEEITHVTGEWCLRLLLATLLITPLRRFAGWNGAIAHRRMLGLFAFFYGVLHFLTYLSLDLAFDFGALAEDLTERPYILLGFSALLLMVPLAATSTRAAIKRLGKRWITLHRLVYLSAALGVAHFVWLVKSDLSGPLVHAAVLAVLLGARLWKRPRAARA